MIVRVCACACVVGQLMSAHACVCARVSMIAVETLGNGILQSESGGTGSI